MLTWRGMGSAKLFLPNTPNRSSTPMTKTRLWDEWFLSLRVFRLLSSSLLLFPSEQATPLDSIKDIVRSSVKVPKFNKHLKKARGHISQNVVEITIKIKTIVRKLLMIKTNQASSQKFRQLRSVMMMFLYKTMYNERKYLKQFFSYNFLKLSLVGILHFGVVDSVSLFNGISTFVSYLMLKPSL